MTREEFARLVRRSLPADRPVSEENLEFAVDELLYRRVQMTRENVRVCIDIADLLQRFENSRHARRASLAEAASDADKPAAFASMLTIDDLLQKLQPLVKGVRERIFHRTDAPFSSMNDAAAWIKGKAAPSHVSDEVEARLSQLDHDLSEMAIEWLAHTGLEWRECELTRFLPYEDSEEGGVKIVRLESPKLWEEHPAIPSPVLVELEHAVEGMYKVTEFYKDALVTYILTGIPPVLPAFKTIESGTWHELTGIFHRQVTMEFLTGDVKDTDIRLVRGEVKRTFKTTNKMGPVAKNEDFLALVKRHALVKQHGPIPRGRGSGAKDYWESIRQEWNKVACKPLASWKAAEKKYDRLMNSFIDRTKRRAKGVKR